MTKEEKFEIICKLLAKSWFYGDWVWETPNERVMEMLMREVGLYPFSTEDEMIDKTAINEQLYLIAKENII